jgi:CubicO group peptidase (beta-lactamase class C family)
LEMYRNGADAETQVNLNQATQSVLSILFGIAMDEEKVALDDKMLDYFPGIVITTDVKLKQRITLENLLAHTTGMDLRRWDVLSGPHEESDNWVQYALNIPLVSTPSQTCDMSSATSHILAGVLHQATGGDLLDYARSRLFSPLGIVDVGWDEVPPGIPRGDGGLMLTPRDMAKLGYLYLREGKWDAQQIVAADWVKKSTCQLMDDQHIDPNVNNVMCYDWFYANEDNGIWATHHPRFVAWGSQGQSIIGIPDKDIVLVTTGHTEIDDILMFVMADSFLVSSAMSDTALPPNPAAYAQLQEKVKQGR